MRSNSIKTKKISIIALILVALVSFVAFISNVKFTTADVEDKFYMIEGASVRLLGEDGGIRFLAKIDEEETEAEYHMMIIPESYITTYNLDEGSYYEDLKNSQYAGTIADMVCEPYEDEDYGWCVRGSIVGVRYNNINRNFVGIAYKAIKDEDGNIIEREYASKNVEKTARSISNVISRFMNVTDITTYHTLI